MTGNLAHDPQSEGTRADWLVEMLDLLPDPVRYTRAVAPVFARASEAGTGDLWDVAHLAHLLRVLAERGDAAAADALRAGSARLSPRALDLVAPQLLRLDGLAALPALAARFGADAPAEGGWAVAVARETFGSEAVDAILGAATDPRVKAYLASTQEADAAAPRPRLDWAKFLSELDSNPRRAAAASFGRRATAEELSRLVDAIDAGGPHLELLLYAGRERLPRMPIRLLELAAGDGPIAQAAIAALVQFREPEVLVLGRSLVDAGRFDAVALLTEAGDEELAQLAERLPTQGKATTLHHIGMDLLELCNGRGPAVAPLLVSR